MEDKLLELLEGEEENLTTKEINMFIWNQFLGEEEDLTDKEKEAWEVIK